MAEADRVPARAGSHLGAEPFGRGRCEPTGARPPRGASVGGLGGLLLGAWLGACADGAVARGPAVSPTESSAPPMEAIDLLAPPETTLPRPRGNTASAQQAIVVLTSEDPYELAERTLQRFFLAVAMEDANALGAALMPGATQRQSADSEPEVAEDHWQARFDRHDYTTLVTSLDRIFESAEYFDRESLELVGASRDLVSSLEEGEILARVRLTEGVPPGLFGREMVFILGPREAALGIDRIVEEYGGP